MNSFRPNPIITAILAGGQAKRFGGQDKGEILLKGQRLIDIINERLKLQSSEIIISGTHDYGLDFTVIADAASGPRGPAGGIYAIWRYLKRRNVYGFFTVAIDGPNLPKDLTERLFAVNSSIVAIDDNGRHPTYSWWRMNDLARVFDDINMSDSISLNRLTELAGAQEVRWSGDKNFANINSPDDLIKFVKGA